jgi:hypothetical protein
MDRGELSARLRASTGTARPAKEESASCAEEKVAEMNLHAGSEIPTLASRTWGSLPKKQSQKK